MITLVLLCLFPQSCPTLCDPMDCSLLGSSVHGILQASILEWVAFPSPGHLPNPGSNPDLPHCRRILYHLSHQGSQEYWSGWPIPSPGDLPEAGIELQSPALQVDSLPAELPGKPYSGLLPFNSFLCSLFNVRTLVTLIFLINFIMYSLCTISGTRLKCVNVTGLWQMWRCSYNEDRDYLHHLQMFPNAPPFIPDNYYSACTFVKLSLAKSFLR